jgi:mannose-6-phosphate isomerase-like protein (cupin superfamily)
MLVVRFPPDSVMADPAFDPEAAGAEQAAELPGLVERFEADGFHTTPTVDFVIVLEGELVLELDDGVETTVRRGDIVIQKATRHAWHNRADVPAVIAGVLLGINE